jgi:hypothetical protein
MFNLKRFNREIEKAGLTATEIDTRMGIAGPMTYKYRAGKRTPSPEQLYKFLLAMGWTEDDLRYERLVDWYGINGQS